MRLRWRGLWNLRSQRLIVFGYDDGSYEYAVGEHAEEVMKWLNSAQAMMHIHGGEYRGRKMVESHALGQNELESITSITQRTFPEWIAELNKMPRGMK